METLCLHALFNVSLFDFFANQLLYIPRKESLFGLSKSLTGIKQAQTTTESIQLEEVYNILVQNTHQWLHTMLACNLGSCSIQPYQCLHAALTMYQPRSVCNKESRCLGHGVTDQQTWSWVSDWQVGRDFRRTNSIHDHTIIYMYNQPLSLRLTLFDPL